MKKFLSFAIAFFCCFTIFADASGKIQQVKVSAEAERNNFRLKKDLEAKAKKAAKDHKKDAKAKAGLEIF